MYSVSEDAECLQNNSCDQLCIMVNMTQVCSCRRGYQLNSDSTSCSGELINSHCVYLPYTLPHLDTDECIVGSCSQNCANTNGSFTCSCRNGFSLDSDGRSCNGKRLSYINHICMSIMLSIIHIAIVQCLWTRKHIYHIIHTVYNHVLYWREIAIIDWELDKYDMLQLKLMLYLLLFHQFICCMYSTTDINECLQPLLYACNETYLCNNTDGGFECICPPGTASNGTRCLCKTS